MHFFSVCSCTAVILRFLVGCVIVEDVLDLFLGIILEGFGVRGMVNMGVRVEEVIRSLLIGLLREFCLLACDEDFLE